MSVNIERQIEILKKNAEFQRWAFSEMSTENLISRTKSYKEGERRREERYGRPLGTDSILNQKMSIVIETLEKRGFMIE